MIKKTNAKNNTKQNNNNKQKDNNDSKNAKEENKQQQLKNIYLVDYYIKDLTLDKVIETNMPEKVKSNETVLFKGKKPILEGIKSVFPKVEEALKKIKDGEEITLKLDAIDSYGLRNKELVRVVPLQVFKENKITPFVGLTFETEGIYGIVKSI